MDKFLAKIMEIIGEWPWWVVGLAVAALIALTGYVSASLGEMGTVSVFSSLVALALVPFAFAALFISLRLADRIGGMDWSKMRRMISETPMTATIYATGRWIAGAMIIAAVLR